MMLSFPVIDQPTVHIKITVDENLRPPATTYDRFGQPRYEFRGSAYVEIAA